MMNEKGLRELLFAIMQDITGEYLDERHPYGSAEYWSTRAFNSSLLMAEDKIQKYIDACEKVDFSENYNEMSETEKTYRRIMDNESASGITVTLNPDPKIRAKGEEMLKKAMDECKAIY